MNRFNNITKPLMWLMALVLTAFIAGCGGGSSSSTSVPSVLNSAKSIDTFSIAWSTGLAPGRATGTIDQALKTIKATVPHSTLLTPMIATFTASPGVSVTVGSVPQVSGSTQNDYTLPLSYKVTAADASYATYTALVSRDPTLASLVISPASAVVPVGATQEFMATAHYLDQSTEDVTTTASWTSGDVTKATVDLHTGLATAVSVTPSGTPVVITATIGGIGGKSATAPMTVTNAALLSLAITPASGVVAVGSAKQFVATGTYTDGSHPVVTTSTSLSWTSSDVTKATVGLHTGAASGVAPTGAFAPVVITATMGTVSNTADLTVTGPPGPVVCTGNTNCVNLGTAANYAMFGKAGVTNVPTSATTGNVGSAAAASTITGFALVADSTNVFSTSTQVTGKVYAVDYASPTPSDVGTASTDMGNAFTAANNITGGAACPGSGTFSGLSLAPGIYKCSSAVSIPTNLTLAGTGAATDVWVFQITGTLTQSSAMKVLLTNGALPQNVFWAVAGSVSIGTTAQMEGVILGQTDINVLAGATVNGRLLAQTLVNLAGGTNTVKQP